MPSKRSPLLSAAAAAVLASVPWTTPSLAFTSVAPTLPSIAQHQGQSAAAASPLFRAEMVQLRKTIVNSQLFMTGGGESAEGEEAVKQEEKAANEKKDEGDEESTTLINKSSRNDESGGFFLTLLLAPPLIAKFCIVLLVKFATDAVVYPILWLWRLASRAKRKVLGIFGAGEKRKNDEAKPINGDGSATSTNSDFA